MQVHQLKRPKGNKAKKTRVGRGGKRGYTSGRGSKGQKARAGHRIRPAIRDLIQRLPKKRGYKNKPKGQKTLVFNVSDLDKLGLENVSLKTLSDKKLIKRTEAKVKILGQGELKKALKVSADLSVSKSAQEKIEKAGGSLEKTAKE